MRKAFIIICLLLLLTAITGCVSSNKPIVGESVIEDQTVISDQEPDKDESDDTDNNSTSEYPTVFDFAVLSEDDYPRGIWSIKQLAAKYGSPERIEAIYWGGEDELYQSVSVKAWFKDIEVIFRTKNISTFSFAGKKGKPHPLHPSESPSVLYDLSDFSEYDKNIEFEIMETIHYNADLKFPFNIKIGQSTKNDIFTAYPEDAVQIYQGMTGDFNEKYIDKVYVFYDFLDENGSFPEWDPLVAKSISYEFAGKELLQCVEILWSPEWV